MRVMRDSCADERSREIGSTCRKVPCGNRAQSSSDLGGQCRYKGVCVFPSVYLLTQESEQLRLIIFEIYASILAKVSRMTLAFPLRHQILNLLILLVLHLKDVNAAVVEVRSRDRGAWHSVLTGS